MPHKQTTEHSYNEQGAKEKYNLKKWSNASNWPEI